MSESVVTVSELTRRFGDKTALASVSLSMPRGAVYGLVGENGAGKTTLIKHILGLRRTESGSVRVFRLDPVADPVAVLSRVGYLSEENDEADVTRLRALIRRFGDRGPAAEWSPSRVFGRISGRSWGVLEHKHLDHHLRQFGV